MDLAKLDELFRAKDRIAVLGTVSEENLPNTALFGSANLHEDKIVIGMGENQSLRNLRKNPHASLMVFIPGPNPLAFSGCRLTLKRQKIEQAGNLFNRVLAEIEANAGRTAAMMIRQVVSFRILASRPLAELIL